MIVVYSKLSICRILPTRRLRAVQWSGERCRPSTLRDSSINLKQNELWPSSNNGLRLGRKTLHAKWNSFRSKPSVFQNNWSRVLAFKICYQKELTSWLGEGQISPFKGPFMFHVYPTFHFSVTDASVKNTAEYPGKGLYAHMLQKDFL